MAVTRSDKRSVLAKLGWVLALPLSFAVLAFFSMLPLQWKDQAVLGFLLIVAALIVNRFYKSRIATLFLTLSACFCTARYAYYRYSETFWNLSVSWSQINIFDAFFVLLLIAAETYSFVIVFLGSFQTARPLRRPPAALPEDPALWPTIDVFIPTYNEPLEVVAPTVLAALTIDWPAEKIRVSILDDGRRASFSKFAEECGATYITRLENSHAKAGNINHAMRQTDAEFIAIFDCDHVPTRSFLQVTVGWLLAENQLAMVQTPHHFYSPDPFERNLGIFRKVPNESALFYGIIQDGSDLWNATFFCGSCAIIRRTALEEIGGIAVETVTEDAHTALRLHSLGWTTAYINLPQAAGLATSRLADHVGQRIRWARGMVQILRVDCPLFKRGLKFPQRLCYLNSMLHYLFAVPRLIFLTSPLVYLLLGRFNVMGYLPTILAFAVPHLVLTTMINSRIHGRHRHSFWNEVYEIVLMPYILLPTMLALINPKWGKFNVTAKDSLVEGDYFDWNIARPFGVLFVLSFLGICVGGWRWWLEGDPQGVLAINLFWASLNMVMLGAAMAVAYESRQLRATVRVPTKLAIEIILENGERIEGRTVNISLGGMQVNVVKSGILRSGQLATVELALSDGLHSLPVSVIDTSGSMLRLSFGSPDLSEQLILTRLVFGRADTWLDWSSEYEEDRPLRNLMRIFAISARGVWQGLAALRPKPKPKKDKVALRNAGQAATPVLALLALGLASQAIFAQAPPPGTPPPAAPAIAAPANAEQANAAPRNAGNAKKSPAGEILPASLGAAITPANGAPSFRDSRELGSLGRKQGILLSGNGSQFTLYFGLPITKIVLDAGISLSYRVPPGLAGGSRLDLHLNGSLAGTLPLGGPADSNVVRKTDITIPADFVLAENSLRFEFTGSCESGCDDESGGVWIAIEPATEIRTSGTLLPLPNRLTLLPAPFVEQTAQHVVDVPFVFDEGADAQVLQAAGITASWFGMQADYHGIRFPVSIGRIPAGNVVLLATEGSALAASLGVESFQPGISIRNNPNDPYGKVLAIVAANGRTLIDAARAFALERFSRDQENSPLSVAQLPEQRKPYDAPRWVNTDKDVRVAEGIPEGGLQVSGSGSVNLYFRLPPDLYFGSRDAVPFHLTYRSSPLADGSTAYVRLHLNGVFVGVRTIPNSLRTDIHEEVFHLPVSTLYPRNTLTVEFAFERARLKAGGAGLPTASVLKSSELRLKGMAHFSTMPRLEMFASSGFPYTRLADLSETVAVLPTKFRPDEAALFLTMVGAMSGHTGYPGLRLQVMRPEEVTLASDKDILLIGNYADAPLFSSWAKSMLATVQPDGFRLARTFDLASPVWYIPGTSTAREKKTLEFLLQSDVQVEGVLQGFRSPLNPERSVVAIASVRGQTLSAMTEEWAAASSDARIYGAISIFSAGQFNSFSYNPFHYTTGSLSYREAMQFWARQYYWLSPILIFACIGLLTIVSDRLLEARAAERLELVED